MFQWTRDRNFILLTFKIVLKAFISVDTMLTENSVVLDLEAFHYNKSPFITKQLSALWILPVGEKGVFTWLTTNLNVIDWSARTYPYNYITQICQSVSLGNPKAEFYEKSSEKTKLLTELLNRTVIDLDDHGCPTVNKKNKTNFINHFV